MKVIFHFSVELFQVHFQTTARTVFSSMRNYRVLHKLPQNLAILLQGGWIFLPWIFLPGVVSFCHILDLFATKMWFETSLDLFATLKTSEILFNGPFLGLGK